MEIGTHRRLNLGCGQNRLPEPWENFDAQPADGVMHVDLNRRLPFEKGSARFVLLEHVIEHLTFRAAMALLVDVKHTLGPGGVLRLCFPDATRASVCLPAYERFLQQRGLLVGTGQPHVLRQVLLGWNHASAWTWQLARAALEALGYVNVTRTTYGVSQRPDLHGVDGHHLTCDVAVAEMETTCLEAECPS